MLILELWVLVYAKFSSRNVRLLRNLRTFLPHKLSSPIVLPIGELNVKKPCVSVYLNSKRSRITEEATIRNPIIFVPLEKGPN
jgi:hypothetical protein